MSSHLVTVKTFDNWPSLMLDKQMLERNGIHAFSQDEYLANSSLPPALEGYRLQVAESDLPAALALLGKGDVVVTPQVRKTSGTAWLVYLFVVILMIVSFVAFVNSYKSLATHFVNLISIDKGLQIYHLLINGLIVCGCLGLLARKKWAWCLVVALLVAESIRYVSDAAVREYFIAQAAYRPMGLRFVAAVISLIITSIFCLPLFTQFVGIDKLYRYVAMSVIAGILCAVPFFLPASEDKTISFLYIDFQAPQASEGQLFYRGKPYTGVIVDRHENGNLKTTGRVNGGFKEGEWLYYFPSSEQEAIAHFTAGKINGEYKQWHTNGNIKRIFNFRSDTEHGAFYEYEENGRKVLEKHYLNGNLHGPYLAIAEHGLREEHGYYRNDQPDSLWTTWIEGVKFKEENFRNGLKHGKTLYWLENGKLGEEQFYINDKPTGTWTEWDRDGNVISVEVYRNGVLVE